ncbi:hypothetical protein QBC36DRAFT_382475 [Triangularia setosa]|uniref:Uncharacterized protein n=1 Tax=Triangularia setosa TaxID=2587417 RepID=A0AAN6VY51_9PEZI|nr:hypothetical protein QBC36DRAFT_382475 [Podospora setosa]
MAGLMELSRQSCLEVIQAGRRCRRALSQTKRKAIMETLLRLDLSEPKDVDLETKLFSDLSYECLCRDHHDDETAKTLVDQWKAAFQNARSQHQKMQTTPPKRSLSTESNAETETQSPDASTKSVFAPAVGSAGRRHDNNTQLKSPPLSSKESEEKASASPQGSRTISAVLREEGPIVRTVEQPTPAESPSPPKYDFTKPYAEILTGIRRNRRSSSFSSAGPAKERTPTLDLSNPFPGFLPKSASPSTKKTPPKLDFTAPLLETTPSKSPETSKPTPSCDFTQLFKTPDFHKPALNPQKSTPAPASFKFDPSGAPCTSSTKYRLCSPAPSLSPSESSPGEGSLVFSSSSTTFKTPANREDELSNLEDHLRDKQQRQSFESKRCFLKNLKESVDMQNRFFETQGDSTDKADEKVLSETDSGLTGLGERKKELKTQVQVRIPRGNISLHDTGYHADAEDENSGQDDGSNKGEEKKVESILDSSFHTPKTTGPGLSAGGQSKFDFVFNSGVSPK